MVVGGKMRGLGMLKTMSKFVSLVMKAVIASASVGRRQLQVSGRLSTLV